MKLDHLLPGAITCLLIAPLQGQIAWDGGGANTLWTTPENWANDQAPALGNTYLASIGTVRSTDANTTTFAGDSLRVENGAILNLFRTNGGTYFVANHSIPGLTVSAAEIRPQSSNASIGHQLNTPVQFLGASKVNMNEPSGFTMRMFFNAAITGSGTLDFTRDTTGSTRSVQFTGDASGYAGNINFAGFDAAKNLTFDVNNAGGWGTGTVTVGNHGVLALNQGFSSAGAGIVVSGTNSRVNLPAAPVGIGALTQSNGVVAFEITKPTGATDPVADRLDLSGALAASGGKFVLDLKVVPLTGVPYTLVSYGTMATQPVIEIVDTANAAYEATINYGTGSNSTITVTFNEFSGVAGNLEWTGASDSIWDVDTTTNWKEGASATTFAEFDNVLFGNTPAGPEALVTLNAAVNPTTVTFDSTIDYRLSGAGAIAGITPLTKKGSGLAILATNNTYVGATEILAGTLQVGEGGATGSLGSGPVWNDGTLAFQRSNAVTQSVAIGGSGNLVQLGTGTLALTGNNGYTGTTTVSSGTLQIGDGSSNAPSNISSSSGLTVQNTAVLDLPRLHGSTPQTVTWNLPPLSMEDGSTLRFRALTGSNYHTVPANLTVSGNVAIESVLGGYSQGVTWTGTLSGSGDITFRSSGGNTSRELAFTQEASTYTGSWFVSHGSTYASVLRSSAPGALGSGTVYLSTRGQLATSVAGGLNSLAGVDLGEATSRLVIGADTVLPAVSGLGGTIAVNAGTLTLGAMGIPDAGDVSITAGAVLHLNFSGTDQVRDLILDGSMQAAGIWGAVGSGAEHETAAITGTGKLLVIGSDPFPAWVATYFPGSVDPAVIGKTADPDLDGQPNYLEFALNGHPANAAASGKLRGGMAAVGGANVLTLTLPVRDGAVFGGGGEKIAEKDGLRYRIQASESGLSDWAVPVVSEVTPALTEGLPVLDVGWSYRSFRSPGDVGSDPSDFIRAVVETL